MQNTLLPVAPLLQAHGRMLSLEKPVVMGILNATPDSFYAGSRMQTTTDALRQAEKMLSDGAQILDAGGASTRPGAAMVTPEEERTRVVPVIEAISKAFPDTWISVDSFHASVVRTAVEAGATIVNDISAGMLDAEMLQTVAGLNIPYIAMHMQGTPQNMQQAPTYENVVSEVFDYLRIRMQAAHTAGIKDVILDVGFGFGKTLEHNYTLLRHLADFRVMGCPLLSGISRKGMVWKSLDITPDAALNGTTALHMAALLNGASILRAHDVREAVETVRLAGMLNPSDQ